MGIKSVAEACVVGLLISQIGFIGKPFISSASDIDKKIFSLSQVVNLQEESPYKKSYKVNITGKEGCVEEETQFKKENNKIEDAIVTSAVKYGVDEKLIKSLIKQESNFDPQCVSSAGAIGLMQIMPNTIKKFNVKDPYDVYQNVDAGTKHLKGMIERYSGDIVKAIAAYNCGGNALDKSGFESLEDVSMLPKETRIHVTKVFHYYENGF